MALNRQQARPLLSRLLSLAIIPTSQVLYGTDYPFWDGRKVTGDSVKRGLRAADLMAIDRRNAVRLFPRLKA
jgi:predicted TIM-barrel fold metal-dependent hydrolase